MGITKLMHINQGSGGGNRHLKNALEYILQPGKTKDGLLVGGNSGTLPLDVLATFLETKQSFGKLGGRQGYHFIISFAKGETDEQTAYQVIQEFCREYLGDDYDYVFAVHDDKAHVHGHIIFNSVSRADGYKYHYKKGDWERYIQPVTDKVCRQHNLAPLAYEEERIGEHYAAWKSKMTNRDIAKADIDFAIEKARDLEGFFKELRKMGYEIKRHGSTIKGEGTAREYFSMMVPADVREDAKGKGSRAIRNTSLGEAYSVAAIRDRIGSRAYRKSYENAMEKMQGIAGNYLKPVISYRSPQSQRRLFAAANYYKLPNPYAVPAWRVREDMKNINRMAEQCRYLQQMGITSKGELKKRIAILEKQISYLSAERKSLYQIRDCFGKEISEKSKRLEFLNEQMERSDLPDMLWETYAAEAEGLEAGLPDQAATAGSGIKSKTEALKALRKELKLVKDILETETQGSRLDVELLGKTVPPARKQGEIPHAKRI